MHNLESTASLDGEVEQTIATLRGEASNVRVTRDAESLQEIADQLEYRANQLEQAHTPTHGPADLFDARDRATFRAALETWGIDAQADKAEEEAAEFVVASKHYGNGTIGPDELIDELADLRIMYEQLALFMGRDRVERRVSEKMDRLRDRLPADVDLERDADE